MVFNDLNGRPIKGATVATIPATRSVLTNDLGEFLIAEILMSEDEESYQVVATRQGFQGDSAGVLLTASNSAVRVDLRLREENQLPPGSRGSLIDIRTYVVEGGAGEQGGVKFRVEVLNAAGHAVREVIVHDTLDAAFGYVVSEEALRIDRSHFPEATFAIDPTQRSFSVSLGEIETTQDFVRAFDLTIPPPSEDGVWCNRVTIEGRDEEERHLQHDVHCIVKTAG
ncbi:hypothetical protein BH18GEM1_BH18GEM1_05670 [soil metagenome]